MSSGASNGTFQHALMLSRACARLGHEVTLFDIQPGVETGERAVITQYQGVVYRRVSVAHLSPASLNIVVGLWDRQTVAAAYHLSQQDTRVILAPTVYWDHDVLSGLPSRVEAVWYVSWDQALHDRDYWHAAERVEVMRCAVDTERFRACDRAATGRPWRLGRHSRDVPAKFSPDVTEYIQRIAENHDIRFRMLGAARTMAGLKDDRVELYGEDDISPEVFLAECDVWVFAHAPYWRETACVAMLEAMASGLPVVVEDAGGMREYVQHGRTGFLCRGLDEFVKYTSLLLEVPKLRDTIGAQARVFVERFHSMEALTEQLRPIISGGAGLPASAAR
jgi:glycosyltransferase involved in cell wall biosynthesis